MRYRSIPLHLSEVVRGMCIDSRITPYGAKEEKTEESNLGLQ